jgi:hypothetical protein
VPLSKNELALAKQNAKKAARKAVVERGLFQFRLDADTYNALLDLAQKQRLPVSAMVRAWVEERLTVELSEGEPSAPLLLSRIEQSVQQLKKMQVRESSGENTYKPRETE